MKFSMHVPFALLLAVAVATPVGAAPSTVDHEIRFWEARMPRDPDDYLTPTKLGAAYLQKARETGHFAYYLKAREVLQKALERKPDHYTAMASLAGAYAAEHRFNDAIRLAEKVVAGLPTEPYGYGILGDAYLEMGDVARAEAIYKKLVQMAPGLFSYSRMANLTHVKGDVDGAIALLKKAAEAGSRINAPAESVAWCHVNIGEMNFSSGRWAEAEKHYRQALKIMPGGYLAMEHLAELRAEQKRYPEALDLYRQVIAKAPHPDFYAAVADIHAELNRPAEAKQYRQKALAGYLAAVAEGNIGYYRHLANYYADTAKDPAEALKWARKDLEVRKDAHAYDTLAWAHYRAGNTAEALAAIKKALAPGTRDAELFYHAGLIFHRANQDALARTYLRRALETNPRFAEAADARRTLRTLGATSVRNRMP
ncbi:MAG TPA: tetratricopeptide repeat protein [Armatimonadota bacterium]|nr:tetratricopeptide repeat protein [Armatimonadota bacterium]